MPWIAVQRFNHRAVARNRLESAFVPGYQVIIPARDEESTVGGVVRAALAAPRARGVLVVDDGSRDGTVAAARAAGARVVRARRRGKPGDKARALSLGVAATSNDVVVFFDADLTGVHPLHFEALAAPVLAGEAALSCGMVYYGAARNPLFLRLPPITGLRALRREVFEAVPAERRRGFQIELMINEAVASRGWQTTIRVLHGLHHRTKVAKRGWRVGLPAHLEMTRQLAACLGRMPLSLYRDYLRGLTVLPPLLLPGSATAAVPPSLDDAADAAF